jgi:pimeloyl-ACP methyl ester carboxylesterase
MAREEFRQQEKMPRKPLRELLGPDLSPSPAPSLSLVAGPAEGKTLVLFVNGNASRDWRTETELLQALTSANHAVAVLDPRGVGPSRPRLTVAGHDYADPISSVDANIAYNAFLVGRTLIGLRVADVLAAVRRTISDTKPRKVVICGRADGGLVACFAAAIEPAIEGFAAESIPLSFAPLFSAEGFPINASSIVPGLLREFGDLPDLLEEIRPWPVLVANVVGEKPRGVPSSEVRDGPFSTNPRVLIDWLRR